MSFTKVAPAGIGTEPGNSILIGDSLLHSTGIDIGSNTGIGVTIRKHGDATFTGIITASAFFGDGSGLEGVSSSGIGTPLSDDDTSDLNKIYYVNQELSIGSTVTVNHPDSAVASYTHYQDLVVTDDADFIVADGDTFIPDVLGIRTSTSTASAATGGRIRAGTLTNAGANGAPNFPNGVTGTSATFTTGTITGNLGVGGVLTYEDVTNIDSVGVITARSGILVSSGSSIGIGDASPTKPLTVGTTTPVILLDDQSTGRTLEIRGPSTTHSATVLTTSSHDLLLGTNNTEKLRITSDGDVAITTRGSVEGVSKLNVEIPSRTTAFSASDGDTWHDVLIENPGGATNNAVGLCFQVTGDLYHKNAGTGIAAVKNGTNSDYGSDLVFITRPQSAVAAERLRITSDGKVLIKTLTDVFGGTDFGVKGQISIANDNAYRRAYLSGSNNHLYFWNGSNQPYISSGGSFVNASDQSLKKDITDLTYGIDVLKNLKPRKYKMKADDKEQIGFIAQEVETAVPEVVDASEAPNGDQHKGLSYGNLTAVLTKALQEAIAKIEKLEAEVNALKGS
jgi:hypothetical protein